MPHQMSSASPGSRDCTRVKRFDDANDFRSINDGRQHLDTGGDV
jgi:hypothetical protein